MNNIGIVGMGFVGGAVREGMRHAFGVYWYDKYKDLDDSLSNTWRCADYKDLNLNVDGPIFVCVPTPMKPNGECDTSIVEDVLQNLDDVVDSIANRCIILKSTLPPGTTTRLSLKYKNLSLVFNPEFLRETTAIRDFKNQDRIIIGGDNQDALTTVKMMYQQAYPNSPVFKTESAVAEMVKYVGNCFLATKVAFANEVSELCSRMDIDYDKVIEYASKDKRLGQSHWAVPGPDGHKGFGGSCFPKDVNGLLALASGYLLPMHTLKGAWHTNMVVRPEKDWEQLKGRAVSA